MSYPPYAPYPPPVAGNPVAVARILAAASGGVALLGFFATLLPVLTVNAAQYPRLLEEFGGRMRYRDDIVVSFGYYDWITTSFAAVGLVPIALAVAAAAGLLQAVRGTSRAGQAVTMFVALGAVVVVTMTALRPTTSVDFSGELARSGQATDVSTASDSVSMEPSLIITAVALLIVVGLNAWPLLANRGRDAAVPSSR